MEIRDSSLVVVHDRKVITCPFFMVEPTSYSKSVGVVSQVTRPPLRIAVMIGFCELYSEVILIAPKGICAND